MLTLVILSSIELAKPVSTMGMGRPGNDASALKASGRIPLPVHYISRSHDSHNGTKIMHAKVL